MLLRWDQPKRWLAAVHRAAGEAQVRNRLTAASPARWHTRNQPAAAGANGTRGGEPMRLLVVEDDATLAQTLVEALRREGYRVDGVSDGTSALEVLAHQEVDVVLLDRDLPGLGGDAVCRTLMAINHPARILMLTAAGDLADRVAGLDLGADDYLAKPFAYAELLARVRALTRRAETGSRPPVVTYQDLTIDTGRRAAELRGVPLRLTPKEYGVLELLASAQGDHVSVEDLIDEVWLDPLDQTRGVVKVVVYGLRRKLRHGPAILFDSGFGYRLE